MGLVKLATMAAMAIWRLPSCRRQPGCRPKQAACPYLPSLGWGGDGLRLHQPHKGPQLCHSLTLRPSTKPSANQRTGHPEGLSAEERAPASRMA